MKDEIKDNVLTGKDDSKAVTKKEVDEEEDGEAGSGKADGELEGDTGEDEDGEGLIKLKPPRPPRKKVKETRDSPLYEEDIVEGFSFAAFETYDDLEVGHRLILSYMTEKRSGKIEGAMISNRQIGFTALCVEILTLFKFKLLNHDARISKID